MGAVIPSPSETLPEFDPAQDHFARFGLAVRFSVPREDLETRYLQLAQRYHPDQFVQAESGTRRRAAEHSSALNEGYRLLRDPVSRAAYLCKLAGIDLDSSDSAPSPSQVFLIEMIELREELSEKKASGEIEDMRDTVEDRMDALLDRAIEHLEHQRFSDAALRLIEHRYLQRLIEEIDEAQS